MTGTARATSRVKGNRLVAVGHSPCDITDPNQWISRYKYLGDNRRSSKIVQNRGVETWPNDGGNTTLDFYYGGVAQPPSAGSSPWTVCEERNGSNQAVRQYLFGTGGAGVSPASDIVWMDVNSVPGTDNDCNPDLVTTPESNADNPADTRYFYHQDRNWNVVALTEYDSDPNNAANGRVVERYDNHTRRGSANVLAGAASTVEMGGMRVASAVGNRFYLGGPDACAYPDPCPGGPLAPLPPNPAPMPQVGPNDPCAFAKPCFNGKPEWCATLGKCYCPGDGEECPTVPPPPCPPPDDCLELFEDCKKQCILESLVCADKLSEHCDKACKYDKGCAFVCVNTLLKEACILPLFDCVLKHCEDCKKKCDETGYWECDPVPPMPPKPFKPWPPQVREN